LNRGVVKEIYSRETLDIYKVSYSVRNTCSTKRLPTNKTIHFVNIRAIALFSCSRQLTSCQWGPWSSSLVLVSNVGHNKSKSMTTASKEATTFLAKFKSQDISQSTTWQAKNKMKKNKMLCLQ